MPRGRRLLSGVSSGSAAMAVEEASSGGGCGEGGCRAWTRQQEKAFENAVATMAGEEDGDARWDKPAEAVEGKKPDKVRRHRHYESTGGGEGHSVRRSTRRTHANAPLLQLLASPSRTNWLMEHVLVLGTAYLEVIENEGSQDPSEEGCDRIREKLVTAGGNYDTKQIMEKIRNQRRYHGWPEKLKMVQDTNSTNQADASKSGETISKLQKEKNAMMETVTSVREFNSSMGHQLESSRVSQQEAIRVKEEKQVRDDCDHSVSQLNSLNIELGNCKELIGKISKECESLRTRVSELEEARKTEQQQIHTLQKQLAVATEKLKLADVTAIEAMTGYEEQKEKMKYLEERLAQAESQIVEGDELRKKLHNTILELKGNIRVFCRVRPLLRFDGDSNGPEGASISFPTSVESAGRGIDLINQGAKLSFSYDKVFDHAASQEDVFVEISELVQSALDGYKVCIFAYGQTGSGKTYTMMGKPGIGQKGIIPRSLEQVFKTSQFLECQGWNYSMQASALELYNETIRDLLAPGRSNGFEMTTSKQYTIKHDPHGNTTVSGLSIIDVVGIDVVTSLLEKASQSRSVGKTQMNEQSSRSHFVFTLKISGSNENTGQHVQGVLNLIDLAGSERLAKSGSTGDRLKETTSINKSLSALTDVIFAIAKGDDHIPFRHSKLTYLLQPCLGGDSKALMFVNISPEASSVGETICSLRFASRVNACEIGKQAIHKQS